MMIRLFFHIHIVNVWSIWPIPLVQCLHNFTYLLLHWLFSNMALIRILMILLVGAIFISISFLIIIILHIGLVIYLNLLFFIRVLIRWVVWMWWSIAYIAYIENFTQLESTSVIVLLVFDVAISSIAFWIILVAFTYWWPWRFILNWIIVVRLDEFPFTSTFVHNNGTAV